MNLKIKVFSRSQKCKQMTCAIFFDRSTFLQDYPEIVLMLYVYKYIYTIFTAHKNIP